ncbi:MAG: M20/M25/M40 family metallo-hydrolase [Firmicutes bacterium]|nr:M20/M25/M40 family metallo-hydrolase [Bacillota bacterium]
MEPTAILSDLIKINTVNPPGNETAVARYLKQLFDSAGIPNEIIEPEEGRGSFIARLGSGPKKLLYFAHADVVAAGDDWDFDPFSGEIKDGIIYGRGALDCKDLLAAEVSAALQLAATGKPLNGELIVVAAADEETGGSLGAKCLVENYLEKLQADFAINEGAELPICMGNRMIYFLQVGEKGTAWCRLKARGVSCHGSVPSLGENAVLKLSRALAALGEYRPEIKLIPEVETLLRELARFRGLSYDPARDAVDSLIDRLDLERGFAETLRAMTRMTVSPNRVEGGLKTNIVPDRCVAELDIRILPGQDRAYVEGELRRLIGEEIEIEFMNYIAPTFSTSQSDYYRLLESLTLELAGREAVCLPYVSTGSTDSKYLRGAGIPAYGIGHMAAGFDQAVRTTLHGRNERTDVASLQLKTQFLFELARRYLS